uniref:Uncharacterized protein n=1 Tax=Aegilops tauschii subsp. strangulata TaxID=200361 RepID=A0A453CHT6_AEGTS
MSSSVSQHTQKPNRQAFSNQGSKKKPRKKKGEEKKIAPRAKPWLAPRHAGFIRTMVPQALYYCYFAHSRRIYKDAGHVVSTGRVDVRGPATGSSGWLHRLSGAPSAHDPRVPCDHQSI